MHTIPVGVLGASGYAGRVLCGLVLGHPALSLAFATANARRGEVLRVPAGGRVHDVPLRGTDEVGLGDAALVFSALPHGASAEAVAAARAAGARVVDLSSDLRPGRGGRTAPLPDGLPDAVPYGLPELFRSAVHGADLVANPGCYPTSVLLALAPYVREGLLAEGALVNVAAASGVTGAGASPKPELLFAEVTGNYRAYGTGNVHRHLPEMRRAVADLGGDLDLLFTPHLLPVDRGILSTITVPLAEPLADPLAPLHAAWADEPFVEVTADLPALTDVVHRNVVRVTARPVADVRRPAVQLFSAIDNLMKGAAGQAVQNANLMLGLEGGRGAAGVSTARDAAAPSAAGRGAAARRVVKIGGRPQADPALPAAIADAWRAAPGALVVVHGGGDTISELQRLRGTTPTFIGGRRVTTADDLAIVQMALSGTANKQVVAALVAAGVPAVGVSGEDAGMIRATPIDEATFGFAGSADRVDPRLLETLLAAGYLPVCSPVSAHADAARVQAMNVNGDDAAAALAAAVGAGELFFLADVPAVLDADRAPIASLDPAAAAALIAAGVAAGGMAAKLEAATHALAAGVARVRIGDLAALAEPALGTTIHAG